jgi:hypothetical protein
MSDDSQNSRDASTGTLSRKGYLRIRALLAVLKWTASIAFGLVILAIVLALGGVRTPEWLLLRTEVTHQKPYADVVGREYRVTGTVVALSWNDFPNKSKILSVSLIPSPGARNRFVSYSIPLKPGQIIHIVSAWRQFELIEFTYSYLVLVPGAGLPDGIPITMRVNSDGIPDPLVYELSNKVGG